jgi:hypothetical protein
MWWEIATLTRRADDVRPCNSKTQTLLHGREDQLFCSAGVSCLIKDVNGFVWNSKYHGHFWGSVLTSSTHFMPTQAAAVHSLTGNMAGNFQAHQHDRIREDPEPLMRYLQGCAPARQAVAIPMKSSILLPVEEGPVSCSP